MDHGELGGTSVAVRGGVQLGGVAASSASLFIFSRRETLEKPNPEEVENQTQLPHSSPPRPSRLTSLSLSLSLSLSPRLLPLSPLAARKRERKLEKS